MVEMSIYEDVALKIGKLVGEKNKAYGNSFTRSGEILKILYPDGVMTEDYTTLLCITRIIDKLFRASTSRNDLKEDPFEDIGGYCLLMCTEKK